MKGKLSKIANADIDKDITSKEQTTGTKIGEEGWRIDINGNKYKSDLIGQLGTVWLADSEGKLQPQGGVKLSDYKIEPQVVSSDKDILYRKFISGGTHFSAEGGTPLVSITGSIASDQVANLIISIDGTSSIKPSSTDFMSIGLDYDYLFNQKNTQGVFLCTGMHVIRYHANTYTKSDGVAKITSPLVSVNGDFYAESSEGVTQYVVVRQLSQLYKQSRVAVSTVQKDISAAAHSSANNAEAIAGSIAYSPEQILRFFLNRSPTFDELTLFQSNPTEFVNNFIKRKLNSKEEAILSAAKDKVVTLAETVNSVGP